ncbi:MAG TPA: F0F1 ATP synthase subunit B [Candidatus Limnocylindrales bacterium]
MLILATASGLAAQVGPLLAAEGEAAQFQINLFWVIIASLNFALFLAIMWIVILKPVGRMLEQRRATIEQGLKDADAARRERESAADERLASLDDARREAKEILERAQKVADETREREVAATREELDRLRTQATAEIVSEKERALAEVRGEVADLALLAAGKVVGETLSSQRERRLVEEFLVQVGQDTADADSGSRG